MKTYEIKDISIYKGCGPAFAKVEDGQVVELKYVSDLTEFDDWANVADDEQPYLLASGEVKVAEFASQHPEFIRGMASGVRFVELGILPK